MSDNKPSIKKRFNIFPNPTEGYVSIKYDLNFPQLVNVALYEMSGRQVMNLVYENQGEGPHFIFKDLKVSLDPGVYFCRIITSEFQATEKILLW